MHSSDFIIGCNEPTPRGILRSSIVWVGRGFDEGALGLPATHPLCLAVLRVQAAFGHSGRWVRCPTEDTRSDYARRRAALEESKAGWLLAESDTHHPTVKLVSQEAPWPIDRRPGLSRAMRELLILGEGFDPNVLECNQEPLEPRPVYGEDLTLRERAEHALLSSTSVALCFGRTHVDYSPGFSILSASQLDPVAFVPPEFSCTVLRGEQAARAWSYRRRAP
jgi:hypothetical protein